MFRAQEIKNRPNTTLKLDLHDALGPHGSSCGEAVSRSLNATVWKSRLNLISIIWCSHSNVLHKRHWQTRVSVTIGNGLFTVDVSMWRHTYLYCSWRQRLLPIPAGYVYSARLNAAGKRAIAKGRPVCLSVCPSVTLSSHAYAVQSIETHFAPYDRAIDLCQVSWSQISYS